ncbi:hypothetical protein DERP_013744 [Dermatophagoides pteronyssinus]|uniref:Uncharacterized protein n=1 Tax=Dermatophagoides pteronyssinus TaxID=6956 RepID=A0ABQ8JF94_DERPT|nr:hypothetical protein DERP_013744 [Dermatophagoides pteronyssinus]
MLLIKIFLFCLAIKLPTLIFILLSMTKSSMMTTETDYNNGKQQTTLANNQVIKLIIKSYVHEILENQLIPMDELKERLAMINDHIENHPALHQQYLWVGSTPPPSNYNPDHHILEYESIMPFDNETTTIFADDNDNNDRHNHSNSLNHKHNHHTFRSSSTTTTQPKMIMKIKRKKNSEKREQLPSEEICETKEKWEQIIDTHDLFDNKVKVIQEKDMQQFVFTYRCAKNHGKCLGISPLFESECTERYGWMYMYYKPINNDDNNGGDNSNDNGNERQAQWGFVNAPHHCACKLKPKLFNNNNHHNHNHNHHSPANSMIMMNSNEESIIPNEV